MKLKPYKANFEANGVAPYVGAWIETVLICKLSGHSSVAPYVGAWIETDKKPTL